MQLQPQDAQARQALARLERTLTGQFERSLASEDLPAAAARLSQLTAAFPRSRQLPSLQVRLREAQDAEQRPTVSQVRVSHQQLHTITEPQAASLRVDRVIHVGFAFENFESMTSVVQAILFDGSRSLQIAQVPVIVKGNEGVHFFRIERPVQGFGDGGYNIDLLLGGQRLTTATFEVNNSHVF